MRHLFFLLVALFQFSSLQAQLKVNVNPTLLDQNEELSLQVAEQLDSTLVRISDKQSTKNNLAEKRADFTHSALKWVVSLAIKEERNQRIEMLDLIPIGLDSYQLTLSMISDSERGERELDFLLDLIAVRTASGIRFSTVIDYKARKWKSKEIDGITFYYIDEINEDRAREFARKHRAIASKLDSEIEPLTVFLCDNYKEALDLMGYRYDKESIGKYKNGYGVDDGLILSIMGNEDFSHDVLHYYVGKQVERKDRNWVTEEGLAYLWGNAYWTDLEGEMINQKKLVEELRNYLKENPDVSLLTLFEEDPEPFSQFSEDVSVRSTISGIILNEIEKKHGMDGMWRMLRAGREPTRLEAYFAGIDELLGLERANFDKRVERLLFN